MSYLTFDRLKIKANYKYLLERQIQFNQTYNSKNGELTGLCYSSKNDRSVPFNLYIAISNPQQTLTLEFSSKILGEDYPKLISKHTIRQCLENINKLGICRIDVDGILQTGCITSADVTKDVHATLSDETLHALSIWVKNYRRYKWDYYDSEGIDFIRDVKSSKCKECIRIYRKEKEIIKPKNKGFLSILPNKWEVVKHGYETFFKYEYHLNEDGKIGKFYIYEYTWAHTIARTTVSLCYEDGKLSEICSSHSYKENKPYYHYDPSLSCKKIYYTHQGFYPQKIYYSLTDEQHKKYAPELTEDEYKESLSGMERSEYKIDYDSYEYSPNIKNDTNIGFNGLELMSEMGVSSGGDALDNILYYTEWVGLRERNMLMSAKRKERTLVYKYDERGNIVKMIYRYGENMRKHRVDMEKDLFTISIEYVE